MNRTAHQRRSSPTGTLDLFESTSVLESRRVGAASSQGVSEKESPTESRRNGGANKLLASDKPVHDWYRFVLSFPPHLVRSYLQRFGIKKGQRVLDPFCGTGTTLVECQKLGLSSVGIEANPMAHFATRVKLDWTPEPVELLEHSDAVAKLACERLSAQGIEDNPVFISPLASSTPLRKLTPDVEKLLLKASISPLPLHKFLVLEEILRQHRDERFERHQLLALAKALVFSISNLQFGPEVGVGPAKADAPVVAAWLSEIRAMSDDLSNLQPRKAGRSEAHLGDARAVTKILEPGSIHALVTSPPYPNEKDYSRTTRLESVLLGFVKSLDDLRALKRSLVRSNTRGVYKADDDDAWVSHHGEIQRIAAEIEARRIALNKTSGFERLYARVTKLYFGGMARHLSELREILAPGANLAYVVGDQASYLRVLIRTGELLADISRSLGYEVVGIDLFRTRLATATKAQLREEVVVLRWPGYRKSNK